MKNNYLEIVDKAYESCDFDSSVKPETGIILGSGFSDFLNTIEGREIKFSDIKGFPATSVAGHPGLLKVSDKTAAAAGRFHLYEGHDTDTAVLPVFLLWRMGVKKLIITNASGGINRTYKPGDAVIIKDHINLTGVNPLTGYNNNNAGPRFPDMSNAYSVNLINILLNINPDMKQGVYAGLRGPSYETPAEVRMLENAGADMVGMSTVNEVIAARYLGMEIIGISCITNMAAGILETHLNHDDVIETGKKSIAHISSLINRLLAKLSE